MMHPWSKTGLKAVFILGDICHWMNRNDLKLNENKTEVLDKHNNLCPLPLFYYYMYICKNKLYTQLYTLF